jgi:hypothetical protein
LPDLDDHVLYGAFALRENIDDLCATSTSERCRDRREGIEQRALRHLITHEIKPTFE